MSDQPNTPKRHIPQLNAMVRALVEQETLEHPFWVGGYVTRRFLSDAGHLYFDINDEDFSISCMVRERVRGTIAFDISNGLDVEVLGRVRVYERKARVEIDVEDIRLIERPQTVIDGSLLQQLEQKGLWPRTKKPIPNTIQRIGLITSKQSQALHDFEDQYRRDGGTAAIKLTDVRLQGEQAIREIAEAIKRFNQANDVDVIVLTRGGGRTAELSVFDDLQIAEAICLSEIPVVTGIGHQRDHTLADEVADASQITPTAAASFLAHKKEAISLPPPPVVQSVPQWIVIGGIGAVLLIIILAVLLIVKP
jgi:exodeoxyribonuclease VII large subunit